MWQTLGRWTGAGPANIARPFPCLVESLLMRLLAPFLLLAAAPPQSPLQPRADRWWADVSTLAADDMEGRLTGSPGYDRAADYVVKRLRRIGLTPAGTQGWFQPLAFEEQFVLVEQSRAELVGPDGPATLGIPGEMVVLPRQGPRPERVDAPLVYVGYGLHMPEVGHDDFAGLDLRGKIAVAISGGPKGVSGALMAHARAERARLLAERGAVGLINVGTPSTVEIPWSRAATLSAQSGMYFADPSLRDLKTPFFLAAFNPDKATRLFTAAERDFSALAALSDASKPMPRFDLNQRLRAQIAIRRGTVTSKNVVALFPGSDPRLKREYVVLSAHLDHLGVDPQSGEDRVFNGALDNAGGVATLLDIAQTVKARKARPKRSLLFVFLTAEEKGQLGSTFFARRPTVTRQVIIANLNFDMPLPIFPLKSVIAIGAEESSLGASARETGAALGLPVSADPVPERNAFTRSDQYSFVKEGIPALAFKFGYSKGSPEDQLERQWRSTLYHAPADDVRQKVERLDAIRLNDFVADLALRVANAPGRPQWEEKSFFRRFERK